VAEKDSWVSSVPSRPCEACCETFASPSTLALVDSFASAFLYADGKTLKGIGTCLVSLGL
jgi:hypothetical protein